MDKSLRKRHLNMWTIIGVLLLIGFVIATIYKPDVLQIVN